MISIHDAFPDFAAELVGLVAASSRPELADQVPTLAIVDRCRCGDRGCAHFYTAPRPIGAYPEGHTNVVLAARRGLITLDVIGAEIVAVEVLDRRDVKRRLDAVLP